MLLRFSPDSPQLEMPPVHFAEHLLFWLFEVGPVESEGMGPFQVSFKELDSWASRTGVEPTPWEFLTLRHLSRVFMEWAEKAKEKHCKAPWPPQEIDEEKIAKQVEKVFDRLGRSKMRRKK